MVRRPWIGPDMELRFEDQSVHVPHASWPIVWYVRSKFWRAEHDSDLYILGKQTYLVEQVRFGGRFDAAMLESWFSRFETGTAIVPVRSAGTV